MYLSTEFFVPFITLQHLPTSISTIFTSFSPQHITLFTCQTCFIKTNHCHMTLSSQEQVALRHFASRNTSIQRTFRPMDLVPRNIAPWYLAQNPWQTSYRDIRPHCVTTPPRTTGPSTHDKTPFRILPQQSSLIYGTGSWKGKLIYSFWIQCKRAHKIISDLIQQVMH